MMDDLQISVRLEDEPDIVYPSGDADVPEMALTTDAAGGVRGYSPTLGLSLCRRDDDRLRVHDPTDESCALNVAEERAARLAAEAENRRLREQLRRLRPQD